MKSPIIATCITLASLPVFAGSPVAVEEPSPITMSAPSSEWEVRLALYGWAQSLDGDISVAGTSAPVDVSFSDILDNLDFAAMGAIEVKRGRWSFMADLNYAALSSRETTPAGLNAAADLDQFLGNFVVAYEAVNNGTTRFTTYAGARVNSIGLDLSVDNPATVGVDFSDSDRKTWVDPIIGFRFQSELNEKLFFRAVGDIGGFGVASDLTWQAMAGFGYRFTDNCSGLLGYRSIGTDYSDGGFSYDVVAQGPVIGLEFTF